MKRKLIFALILITAIFCNSKSQTTNDMLNVLIGNKVISQEQADSLRADAAIKQQEADAKKKSFPVSAAKAFKIGGYGQIRYQRLEEAGKIDGVDIRRAYLDLRGTISPYWDFRLQADFAGTPKIVDLYTDFKIKDYFNFSIGQQVIPFSLNNTTSNTKLELPDRVQVVEALSARKGDVLSDQNGRDIGIALYGSFLPINDLNLVEYRIGVFNGTGINRADLNEAQDIIGRLILHPIKGLDLGCSYYTGWAPDSAVLYKTSSKDNPDASQLGGLRERIGAELNYTYRFANIKGEYLVGTDNNVSKSGYYVQLAAYIVPKIVQLAGCYDTYDKDTEKDDNEVSSFSFGANYYINSNVLLQAAYTVREEKSNSIDNNIGRVQLQISF
jgi:phosphate-selective porin OprO and OprP